MASKRDYDKLVAKRASSVRATQLPDGANTTRNRHAYASRVIDMDNEAKVKARKKKKGK